MTTRPLDEKMLARLVCPETHQPLTLAGDDLVAQLNRARTDGSLKTHGGQMIHDPIEQVLVRVDGKGAYVVTDGVPNLLADERVDL